VEVLILIAVVAELPEAEIHGQAAVSEKYGMYREVSNDATIEHPQRAAYTELMEHEMKFA